VAVERYGGTPEAEATLKGQLELWLAAGDRRSWADAVLGLCCTWS